MATVGADNNEARAFAECSAVLFEVIDNPESLAWNLYAKGLVSLEIRSKATQHTSTREERVTVLLSAVERQIRTHPKRFNDLLEVLSVDKSTTQVKEKLSAACKYMCLVPNLNVSLHGLTVTFYISYSEETCWVYICTPC